MREERLDYIAGVVRTGRFIALREIVEKFDVDIQTARRDVGMLEEQGLLVKVHGGAMPKTELGTLSLRERVGLQHTEKERLARAAAELVRPQDTLIIDGGSTTSYLPPHLTGKAIQIVTNSLSLLNNLPERWPGVEVLVTGGDYYPRSAMLLGPATIASLQPLHADWLFLSAAGVTAEGLFNANAQVVEVERAMMQRATRTVLLADSSKIGRRSLIHLCDFRDIAYCITTAQLPEDIAAAAHQAGTHVITC